MTSSSFPGGAEDAKSARKNSDFSIEHILNAAGNSGRTEEASEEVPERIACPFVPFPWLHCTRYCPPRIPRTQKKEAPQKRQLGRHPRIPFTGHQLAVLEERFKRSPYLSSQEVTQLSRSLQLADIRVKIWFQNRRARERRERTLAPSNESPTKPSDGTLLLPTIKETTSSNSLSRGDVQVKNTEVTSPPGFRASFENYLRLTAEDAQRHLSEAPYIDDHRFAPDKSKKTIYFE